MLISLICEINQLSQIPSKV